MSTRRTALPVRLRPFLGSRLGNVEMVMLAIASRLPLHAARVAVVRAWGARIHPTATLYHGFQIRSARRVSIGPRSSVGDGAILDGRGGLTIGSDVNLSTQVHIWTAQHDWDSPNFDYESGPVTIGDHVWLSARVTVLPGVSIGEGAVVAAGAVVTRDLESFGLYGGVPARRIRDRRSPKSYRLPPARAKAWWW